MKECMDIRVSKQKDIRLCISLDMSKLASIQCSCRPYSQCLQQCPCIIDLRHPHELCCTQLILNRIISGCADTKAAKALLVFWNRLAYGYITGMHAGFASSISKQGCSRRAAAPPPLQASVSVPFRIYAIPSSSCLRRPSRSEAVLSCASTSIKPGTAI